MIKKSIGLKIAFTLIPVLFISFIALQFFIVSEFQKSSIEQSKRSLTTFSESVFQTVRAAMNLGDSAMIAQSLKDAGAMDGIKELKIHKSQSVIDTFGLNEQPSNNPLIKQLLLTPEVKNIESDDKNGHNLRLLKPSSSCLKPVSFTFLDSFK